MSYDIELNDNESEQPTSPLGNDGCSLTERNTYSYTCPTKFSSPKGSRPSRPSILSVFRGSLGEAYAFDCIVDRYQTDQELIITGVNLLTLSSRTISAMSDVAAADFLRQIRLEGSLMKRGFRGLKLWRQRFFVLEGNVLVYFDVHLASLLLHRRTIVALHVAVARLLPTAR